MQIYFDGGCSPNPGVREVCVVIGDEVHHSPNLGYGTNNQAEWLALLYAMDLARFYGHRRVEFIGDSKLVISQASGAWQCKAPELQAYLALYRDNAKWFDQIKLTHVLRHLNRAGVVLETTAKA